VPPENPRTAAPAVSAGDRLRWRVIVYTFARLEPAEQRARAVNRRWPELQAEVFSPKPGQPPYLVAIGGRMSRADAERLRDDARGKGLPQDTYAQNYSR
jgi:hypothetical protein